MRAARWVVVGTALLAAAIAFYLLMMGPGRSTGPGPAARPVTIPQGPAANGPPQEEIDAESRDAMRDFLRQSVGEEDDGAGGRDDRGRPAAR